MVSFGNSLGRFCTAPSGLSEARSGWAVRAVRFCLCHTGLSVFQARFSLSQSGLSVSDSRFFPSHPRLFVAQSGLFMPTPGYLRRTQGFAKRTQGYLRQITSCPVGTCNVRFSSNKLAKTPVKSRFIRFNPPQFSTMILLLSLTVPLTLSVRFCMMWIPKVTTFGAGSGWRKAR